MDKTTQYVNEYADLTRHMAQVKARQDELRAYFETVSYTHLTLPTICSV